LRPRFDRGCNLPVSFDLLHHVSGEAMNKTYSPGRHGYAMELFDQLPPRLRDFVRTNHELNVGLLLIALDDGMLPEEIIEQTNNGRGWWLK